MPPNVNYWAVDFKFFSEEYPEFVGSSYNDAFFIQTPPVSIVVNSDYTVTAPNNYALDPSGNQVTINTTGVIGMSAANAFGTTYDGATETLLANGPIPSGASQITIVFSVMDLGDSIYDTTVFLDHFRFVEGNPGTGGQSDPPVFDPQTPPPGSVFNTNIYDVIQFLIAASDPNPGDTVTISTFDLPAGATFTVQPPIVTASGPTSSLIASASNNLLGAPFFQTSEVTGNPAVGQFTWTPQPGQEGVHIIPFTITDNNGVSATPLQIVIDVAAIPLADLSVIKTASSDPVNVGEQLTYTLTITNDGPDDAENVNSGRRFASGNQLQFCVHRSGYLCGRFRYRDL